MADDAREKIEMLSGLITAGKLDDAEGQCRAWMDAGDADVNLQAMLGAICLKQGKAEEAETLLLRATERAPDFAAPFADLGALHLSRGNSAKAIPAFERALQIAPGTVSAMRGLASALMAAGRLDEADDLRDEYFAATPLDQLLIEAETYCLDGQVEVAEQYCDAVLLRDPENTQALRVLALAATQDERYVVAEGFLRRIVRLTPSDGAAICELARFLGERGRYDEAVAHLDKASREYAEDADIRIHLGNMLAIQGQNEAALAAYSAGLELRPDDPAALIGQGHILRVLGDQVGAMESYQRSTDVSPNTGGGWWYLASLRRYRASDEDIAIMQRALSNGDPDDESRVALHFALGRAFEARDEFAIAWNHYDRGNRAKRALVSYDPVKTEVEQQKIAKTFTNERIRSGSPAGGGGTPLFIVGMPRSGSTLVEQILASHSQVEGTAELPYIILATSELKASRAGTLHYTDVIDDLASSDIEKLGAEYLHRSMAHRDKETAFFTDKMPANFAHLGLIRMMLPQAKIIDTRRHPLATAVANYRQLFAQGKNQTYDLVEFAEYYLQYLKIMEHWDVVLPGEVLRVQYEDTVSDLETQVHRILEFCGLPFEENCLQFHRTERAVNTASSEQVREPIYDSALEYWRNYEPWLDELKSILKPALDG